MCCSLTSEVDKNVSKVVIYPHKVISRMMTENVSNLSLHKVKQDILIVFYAREILIPENRSNASVNQAGLLTLINNVFPLLNSTASWRH